MIVSLAIHTAIHTAASLVAIAAGVVMLDGMVAGRPDGRTASGRRSFWSRPSSPA